MQSSMSPKLSVKIAHKNDIPGLKSLLRQLKGGPRSAEARGPSAHPVWGGAPALNGHTCLRGWPGRPRGKSKGTSKTHLKRWRKVIGREQRVGDERNMFGVTSLDLRATEVPDASSWGEPAGCT